MNACKNIRSTEPAEKIIEHIVRILVNMNFSVEALTFRIGNAIKYARNRLRTLNVIGHWMCRIACIRSHNTLHCGKNKIFENIPVGVHLIIVDIENR